MEASLRLGSGRAAGGRSALVSISTLAHDPDHVFVELDFESHAVAATFAEKLREMWSDAGERLGLESPTARVVEQVERVGY